MVVWPFGDKVGGRAWAVVAVLAMAQAINQADKAVLGLAAEPIMHELGLTTAQFGMVAGALYATFSLGGLAVALLLAPRIPPRILTTAMLAIWSLSQLPIVFFATMPVLIACRLALGAGEGGGTPTFLNMVHEWFDDHRRDLPGAFVLFGGTMGALIAAPAITYCIQNFGWRSGFLACSIAGFLVAGAWIIVGRDGPYSPRKAIVATRGEPVPKPSWRLLRSLLFKAEVVTSIIVGLCAYWVVGFTVGWLPAYVRNVGGFSLEHSGWILSLIFLGQGALILLTASMVRLPLLARAGSNRARWIVLATCSFGSAVSCAVLSGIPGGWWHVPLLILATGLPNGVFALIAGVLAGTVASERHRLLAIVMSLVTISGMISPPAIGAVISMSGSDGWAAGLLLTALVGLIGTMAAVWHLLSLSAEAETREEG